jgi:hypothetical protein
MHFEHLDARLLVKLTHQMEILVARWKQYMGPVQLPIMYCDEKF